MKHPLSLPSVAGICCAWVFSALTIASADTLYDYAAGSDPVAQGWSITGVGDLSSVVTLDGALVNDPNRQPGWMLCDRATNAGAALTYGGTPWAGNANWSVTMALRWEENAYDATGAVPSGGSRYFLSGNRQNFSWRVGNGTTGYYEVLFGKGGGSTITGGNGALTNPAVVLTSFGQDVSLTLAVTDGEASLFLDGVLVMEHLELTLSQEGCSGMMMGDMEGTSQGCVTLHSVTFLPEPATAGFAVVAAGMALLRRRRPGCR